MGAFTVALGLPSLVLSQSQAQAQAQAHVQAHVQPYFARIPRLKTHTRARKLSLATNLRQYSLRRCSASVSWPHESWATGEDEQEVQSSRGVLEQEGGLEGLAMGLGIAVSVVLAFSKQGGGGAAAGVSVGILSLAFLTATTVALRQQLAGMLRMLVAHFNSVQAALAVQLSGIRNNVIIWGTRNGAKLSSPTAPIESASFSGRQENKQEEVDSNGGVKGLSSAELEAALSNITKSVAQLTMVVANLDNKISSLDKADSNNMPSFSIPISQNNKTVAEDVTPSPVYTESAERQRGTYRIRDGTQLKWEEAVVKERRANQVKPQVSGRESAEDSPASNRVDVLSTSDYDSKALPSTILYDSRGDRVLLLDGNPVDITYDVTKDLSQSAPSKFSTTQAGDSSMELFFQDVAPQEDGEARTEANKQDRAAVELQFQEAGFKSPEAKVVVQAKQEFVEVPTARNPVENVVRASPAAQDNEVFRNKTVPRRGRSHNEADAAMDETSRVSWGSSSSEYELDGSEAYRAVPATLETGIKPDVLRLKRIMSGAEPSAVFANAWTQNETNVAEVSKDLYKENPELEVGATTSSSSWEEYPASGSGANMSEFDEYGRVNGPVGGGRGAARPQGVQDVLSYDGQERNLRGRPRSKGGEGTKPSSSEDYGQRWPREGSSGADFGGNGSSSDTNEGGNGSKRRQGSSRSSGTDNDSDSEVEPPTSQERRPSRASPSYPPERTETFRNLPEPQSDDKGFKKILDEVEALLKEGRDGLEGRIEVGVAERMLYEAAELCEKAVEARPSSLVAVGLWGNTLLLHGELKLRLSQNLQSMLPEPPSKSMSREELKEVEEEKLSVESTLQDVGEECEQLLVEAGRKYRLALSMDRTDMRALYNWGLALCYRGQLIAEEGGETAAQDADKVFLAAIDKFEAMIGLSDTYATGALLNWGLAMRDRSRLRPLESKERRKILGQAKEIFQEALRLDPNYGQARGAVAACVVELKRLQEYNEEEPKKPKDSSPSRGFRDWWG